MGVEINVSEHGIAEIKIPTRGQRTYLAYEDRQPLLDFMQKWDELVRAPRLAPAISADGVITFAAHVGQGSYEDKLARAQYLVTKVFAFLEARIAARRGETINDDVPSDILLR